MQELPFTNRETPGVLSVAGQGIALVCLVGLFAFIGPFGTYDAMGALPRAGYWALALGVNWLVCGSLATLTLRSMEASCWPRRWLAVGGAAVLAAVPGTGVVYTAETLFRPGYVDTGQLPTIYLSVVVVMLAISGLVVFVGVRWAAGQTESPEEGGVGSAPRFLDRLPAKLGADLVCLKMADHYVEAFTTAGSTLVLMRFADAVVELEEHDGLRVYRSHWIACKHIVGVSRRSGRTLLRLTGGHEVPVSRGYLAGVREAGLA